MKSRKNKLEPQPDNSYLSYLQPILAYFTSKPIEEAKKLAKMPKEKPVEAKSDSSYFSYLQPVITYITTRSKKEEVKKVKPRRECSTFGDNITSSLSFQALSCDEKTTDAKLDCKNESDSDSIKEMQGVMTKGNDLKSIADADEYLTAKKIELSRGLIIEHAARRVDLFFYLLVAVHNKQAIITKDFTVKQHGIGSKPKNTHACHSSLFTNVKFTAISTNWSLIGMGPVDPTFKNLRFEDTLNMTTELPSVVNDFDGYLEGKYRTSKYVKSCLDILNKASKNEMDIKTGMNEFFKTLNLFFAEFEKRHLKKNVSEAIKKIFEYEKMGTFKTASKDMKAVDDAYLHSMLFIYKPDDLAKVKQDPKLLAEYYKRRQDEMFSVPAQKVGVKLK